MNSTASLSMKRKNESVDYSSRQGTFHQDDLPDKTFALGDDIFCVVTVYHKKTLVHLRKYRHYGERFYPSTEGITMNIHEFDALCCGKIPVDTEDCMEVSQSMGDSFNVFKTDVENFFSITKDHELPNGKKLNYKVTITTHQWIRLIEVHDSIMELLLNELFKNVSFKSMFEIWVGAKSADALPHSFDVDLGTQHVKDMLKLSLSREICEMGKLSIPLIEEDGEVVFTNSVKDFNTGARKLNMHRVMEVFHSFLIENNEPRFLNFPAINYASSNLLDCIAFGDLICDLRKELCAPIGHTKDLDHQTLELEFSPLSPIK